MLDVDTELSEHDSNNLILFRPNELSRIGVDLQRSELSEEFLQKLFTALVRRLSCFSRDVTSTKDLWSFYACYNTNTNIVSFLDIANNQELLDRIQLYDETGQLDVEFSKYRSSSHDFNSSYETSSKELAPINRHT